ncbi:CHRD domain-containing protein [Tautonia marina]|uniref:CHRD domain-containing protein n=1 Tax=Tautonia marina TaxID=2653855 RepID=UPI0013762923|nr:CHRD domain-containing protein [Tautonia marina]
MKVLQTTFAAIILAVVFAPVARSSTITFTTTIDTLQQVATPNIPSGFDPKGSGVLKLDTTSLLLSWDIEYEGLTGPIDGPGAHLHGPAGPGVNAGIQVWLAGGPSGVPLPQPASGQLIGSTTITSAQADQLIAGLWYVNIHTARNPTGEIRGQVLAIPEPATLGMMVMGGLGVGLFVRHRRRREGLAA